MQQQKSSGWQQWTTSFFLGGISAVAAKTILLPVERLSNAYVVSLTGDWKFVGFNFLVNAARTDGVFSLWKQGGFPIARYSTAQAVQFSLRDLSKRWFNYNKHRDGYWKWSLGNFSSGFFAGLSSLIFHPFDMARSKLLVAKKSAEPAPKFTNVTEFQSLYRGGTIAVFSNSIYLAGYFGFYDTLKDFLPQDNFLAKFGVGWTSAFAATHISHLISPVQRRVPTSHFLRSSVGGLTLALYDTFYAFLVRPRRPYGRVPTKKPRMAFTTRQQNVFPSFVG